MGGERGGTHDNLPAVVVAVGFPVYDFYAGCEELFFGMVQGSGDGGMGADASVLSVLLSKGGKGLGKYPSSHMMPTVMFSVAFTRLQGNGTRDVSVSHGSWSMTARWKRSRSSTLWLASGPAVPWMDSCPGPGTLIPVAGIRRVVGRNPYAPQKPAGARMDPPMSVPTPRAAHLKPIEAPSPPEEPPGERVRL
jgi:hypothetical protein